MSGVDDDRHTDRGWERSPGSGTNTPRYSAGSSEFVDLLTLVTEMTGADAAALVRVDDDGAHVQSATMPLLAGPVDPAGSLAGRLIADDRACRLELLCDADDVASRPHWARLGAPLTLVGHVVRLSGDEMIGAVELVWRGERRVDDTTWSRLERVARHLGRTIELRTEVDEYRRFVEASPDPVTVLNLDGILEAANPAFVELLDHPPGRPVSGRSFVEFVARGDRARVTSELARVLFTRRRGVRTELCLLDAHGREVPCSVSMGHLRGRRLQLVVHDLSERSQAEEDASRLSEQLARAQRLDAVGQIAGGLAHDLNNLLVVMVSNLGLAMESLGDAETERPSTALSSVREDLDELQLAVDRAGDLTSKLMQFARRDDGEAESAEVAGVVDAVQALLARSLGDDVTLRVQLDDDLPPVAADPVQLERVLVNLVINARDALTAGGNVAIEVTTATVPPAADPPDLAAPADMGDGREDPYETPMVRIDVSDDGVGMDAATRSRAFEPLFTTKAATGGSGLGLASVQAFVGRAGGRIAVDSAPGQGTRVSLWIPAGDPATSTVPLRRQVPVGGARVVLIDPGDRTRRVIVAMLEGAGYRVQAVSSGEEALDALDASHADLMITELALPAMPGPRVIEVVAERYPQLRTMALASFDAPRDLGSTPVLVKPFSHTRLLRTVERVMRRGVGEGWA